MLPAALVVDWLVQAGVLDEGKKRSVLARARSGREIPRAVVALGLAQEGAVLAVLAQALKVPRARLDPAGPGAPVLAKLPRPLAESRGVFPLRLQGGALELGMVDPTDAAAVEEIGRLFRARVQPFLIGEEELERALLRHYAPPAEPSSPLGVLVKKQEQASRILEAVLSLLIEKGLLSQKQPETLLGRAPGRSG